MADFKPETTIYLFKDTRVDENNQPYFTNEGAKMSWYFSHQNIAYTNYSYQREQRQYVRVQGKADLLREYDMLAFQNSDNKWVLCNVLGVEFLNPNTVQVEFDVDYMQTYIESTQFRHCWVEREMQENDWDGTKPSWNNLQPEGLETGFLKRTKLNPSSAAPVELYTGGLLRVVVLSAYDADGEPNVNGIVDGNIPVPLNVIPFSAGSTGLNDMLKKYAEKGRLDGIAAIMVVPLPYGVGSQPEEQQTSYNPTWNRIDGYELVNAKCFTSEFCKFELSNCQGSTSEFRPEFFTETDNIILKVEGALAGGTGGVLAYVQGYESNPKSHGVTIMFDVQLAYAGDSFKSWLAGNRGGIASSIISTGISSAITGAVTGNPAIGAARLAAGITETAGKIVDASSDPLTVSGSMSGTTLPYITKNLKFEMSLVSPYYSNIKSIDDFFSMYGYRTNRLKVPNVNTRPLWNYVKTSGAVVSGPFTHTAKIAMQQMLDNGVTFWHVPAATIGDYSDPMANRSS